MSGPGARPAAPGGPSALRDWLGAFVSGGAFVRKYPAYASVLARLFPVADPEVSSMAVELYNGRFYLHVNQDYFVDHPAFLTGILLHEVHHIVLGHLSNPKFHDPEEPRLMELAVEMSANEYIEEPLPNPIVWRAFERYGVRAGQSTLARYQKLLEAMPPAEPTPRPCDDHRPWRGQSPSPGAGEQARRLVEDALRDAERHVDASGPEPTGLRLAGRKPGRLLEELSGVLAAPETYLDWKEALALFSARVRAPVHSYARPSRRFPGRPFEVPGRLYAARSVGYPRLLVAVDTSMSMAPAELVEIARHLARLGPLAAITLAECDAEVAALGPFTGALCEVRGRGGTDLRPVFAPEVLGRVRPDGVIYFTDGQGPFPEVAPPVPVLWVLTKPEAFACPWGSKARLGRPGERRA
ncbi:MAG TPA: VWA-like domain-containing protein [Polyangiaceae bacterium]|nr:VWA-like domain-containing protein [Polyangiaceae bacterium]